MKQILFIGLLFCTHLSFSQDDLAAILNTPGEPGEKVRATFKTTRIINIQTNETVYKRTLDFRVAHRFGAIGKESGGSRHNLWGFDNSADIRVAFEYGITDRLTAGLSRSKRNENYEGLLKYRLLQQTSDNKSPIAVTVFANMAYSDKDNIDIQFDNPSLGTEYLRKLTYTSQLIIARKFSSSFSMLLMPTFIHRNFIMDVNDDNNVLAIGIGGRIKITKRTAIVADYVYNLNTYREINNENNLYNPLGLGVEFETGGHVFSLMFTNAEGIIENEFIPNTTSSWTDGGFRFSFNISRDFKL